MKRKSAWRIAIAAFILAVLPFITFLFLKKGEELRAMRSIPSFELTSSRGTPFNSRELADKVYVAEFTFSRCRSIVCEKLDSMMHVLDDRFGGRPDFRMLTLTFDTPNDSVPVMADLALSRNAESHWVFLTGAPDSMQRLIFGGFFAKPDVGDGEISRMRSDRTIAVIDRKGFIKGYYDVLDEKENGMMLETVEELLNEK